MATIRRVPSIEHHFQLVITRVFEDGDQELLEDEEESALIPNSSLLAYSLCSLADEERVFLIGEELEFRSAVGEDGPSFMWRDLEGDVDEFYEFVASGTNEPTRAFFETCMYRAMYERKYKKSADDIPDSDLQEFIWQWVHPSSPHWRAIDIGASDHLLRNPNPRRLPGRKRRLHPRRRRLHRWRNPPLKMLLPLSLQHRPSPLMIVICLHSLLRQLSYIYGAATRAISRNSAM